MTTYKHRSEIPEEEKWNLTDLYATEADWHSDLKKVEALAQELAGFDGNITDGQSLYEFLKKQEDLSFIFTKVFAYSMFSTDIDTRDSNAQSLKDRATQVSVKVGSATSFFMPFLLTLNEATLKAYINEVKELEYFEEDLWDSFRYKAHVLTKEKEEILSALGEALSSPDRTYGMLNNADIEFGQVTNDDGEKVEMTRGMYSKLIEDEDREKRKEAYKAYYKPYVQLSNTIASTLSSAVKNNVTLSKLRNYDSALSKSLFGDQVPTEVYDNLIATAKKNLEPYHRYTAIRKEILGLDELRQYDLNVSLVSGAKKDISYEEAYETMLTALAPLGDEYIQTLRDFKEKRYIDVRETPAKRSGAYNMGVYGVHPFVLLNHHDDLDSLFTLAHEMGHAMHSHYSSKHQPQITANYTIFVAEVASTVNEVLLIHHLLEHSKDKEMRKYLLNHFIDQFRGTFFTQVMFADFEKQTHELAEQGEPLNAETFNAIYEKLFREYNGPDIVFDEEVKYGWSRIPHFYRPFYVYKYSTGFASSIQIAKRILNKEEGALEDYLTFLKSGSSEYPLELLKKAGVDLTTPEPIESALAYLGEIVSEFESL